MMCLQVVPFWVVFFQQIPHSVEKQIYFNLFIVFLTKKHDPKRCKNERVVTIVFASILRFLFVYIKDIAELNKSKLNIIQF